MTQSSAVKEALASATLLAHPKPHALTNVMTDASNIAVGAVLQQYIDGQRQPISKNLQPTETPSSTFDQELLAVYLFILLLSISDIFCHNFMLSLITSPS